MQGQTAGHIFLVGFQGSGKTTVGQIVARRLGWRFVDVDAEVVRTAGQPIHEIRDSIGLEGHRDLELQVISRLSDSDRSVVACGASSVMDDRFWQLVQETGVAIHLDTRPETVLRRLERKYGGRPWIASPDEPVARSPAERRSGSPDIRRRTSGSIQTVDHLRRSQTESLRFAILRFHRAFEAK